MSLNMSTTLPSVASHSPGFEHGQEGGPETQSVHSVLPEGCEYVKQLRGKRRALAEVHVIAWQVESALQINWQSSGEPTPEVLEVIWSAGQLMFPSRQDG